MDARASKLITVLLLTLLIPSLGIPSVAAQTDDPATPVSDTIWFILSPEGQPNGDFFDVEIDAGQTVTLTATIGNGSQVPVPATIYAADATTDVNGGYVVSAPDAPTTEPTTWLDFPTMAYDFQPQEVFNRDFTVAVPEGAPPGQYITGLAIEMAEPEQTDSLFLVRYRLVTAVFITVPGPVNTDFDVSDINVIVNGPATTITGAITNNGNVRVRPEGTLELSDAEGNTVIESPIAMSSVYAGDSTIFQVTLMSPIPEGDYTASVDLEDPETGATASLSDVEVSVAQPEAPAPVSIADVGIVPMPSAEDVVFAQVTATISNTGPPLAGAELTLHVFKDGEQVDEHALASSVTLQNGDTVIDQPYIPESGAWEPGTYTFQLALSATDANTGTSGEIATFESDEEIVVP